MRVALISTCALATPPLKYGGTELVVAEIAKGLLSLGHDVTVYATGDSSTRGDVRYMFERPVWPPSDLAELRHAGFAWQDIGAAMRHFDIVHVHHAAALPYHVLFDRPTVVTLHHERVPQLIEHYACYPDAAYVAISKRQAQLSPEIEFARVIHHGVDTSLYPAGPGDGGYLAFLGRFAPEKAPHLAIDAARASGMPLRVGGNPHAIDQAQSYFKSEVEPRLAQGSDVTWCGELSHLPKVELLAGARGLLFPVVWEEPFGLVMIEAMLVGTPVIAFARGSAPEVVEDGVTGFLVHDVDEMAARVRDLDGIDRARCRARAQERWSTARMAREYVELYEHVVRRRKRSHSTPPLGIAAYEPRTHTSQEAMLMTDDASDHVAEFG